MLSGRKVLITGGAGYLARGLLRCRKRDNMSFDVTCYSRDEYKQDLCKRLYPDVNYVLGDVRDYDRLELVMHGHDAVIHTAAIKYIPEAEFNVAECIDVNVGGSSNVFQAARKAGVADVIAISTDKAVYPVNTYGATKMLMERLVDEASRFDGPFYAACRYGNVIGSTGSVIPVFQRQLQQTGTITVTDPTMTRYFITVDDAVNLIFASLTVATGSICIPFPKAMKIGDLAISIAGDEKHIQYIGKRPGEKQHETLLSREESTRVRRLSTIPKLYELPRIGGMISTEMFQLTSDMPEALFSTEQMQEAIEDAAYV